MKTTINVLFASASFAGYGHQTITVELECNGLKGTFTHTTFNMSDFDDAMDLEGQEKYDALYDLISYSISEEVNEFFNL
jgi:hypothetical protein